MYYDTARRRGIEAYKRYSSLLALKLCLAGTGLPIGLYHLFYALMLHDKKQRNIPSADINTIEMLTRAAFGGLALLITTGYALSLVVEHNQLHRQRPLHLAEAFYFVINGAALFSLLFCSLSGFLYNGNLLDIKLGKTLAYLEFFPLTTFSIVTSAACLDVIDKLKKENSVQRVIEY